MSTPGAESVLVESRGAVRILTLNRPEKLNAADLAMQQRLLECLLDVAADDDARVLILTGAGRAFSAGGDRSTLQDIASGAFEWNGEFSRVHRETLRCLLTLRVPAIAAVNGPAVGMAAGLVALCDMVVMGEGAFLCDPHVTFGLPAFPVCLLVWPRLTSYAIAKELMMSGRRVPADEAVRIGLANRLCPAGEELATALEMAEMFVGLPPGGVAATKATLNAPLLRAAGLAEDQGTDP